jgi:hypothetical protein
MQRIKEAGIISLIVSVKTSEGAFGSPGQLQEVSINHNDYEMSNNLYDGDMVYSVMLCVQMCLGAVKIFARATQRVQFSIGNAQGRKDWIYATIYELGRLKGGLETIDTPG